MTEDDARRSETFGHYTILRELGRGGQGTVFLAEDQRLRRNVALKVIATAVGQVSKDRLLRFRREVEAASKLDHPNICAIHEAGEVDGKPYIAMRCVEGETLAQRIARAQDEAESGDGSTTPSSRSGISEQIVLIEKTARALHKAHEQGLIHRDIKPGNIMVTPEGEPVILDFGLARDELGDDLSLTHSGDLLGTPAYMSPEQLLAQRVPLDRRTDVYSLGSSLYECLTLRRPFEGATRAELYQRIFTGDPSGATSINRQIPRDLQVVLETAMERDRDRRYQTALEFAEDLRRVREFEPIRAKPVGRMLRLKRWSQRHPALAVAVLGLVLSLAIALGFLARMRQDLRHTRAMALANAAEQLADENPTASLLLARAAVDLEQSSETLSPLHRALGQHLERAVLRHDGYVNGASFSSGGRVLTVSVDETARLWSRDGALLRVVRHDAPVLIGAWAPDGNSFLTVSGDGRVRLWSLDGRELAALEGHDGAVLCAEFAPDGSSILTGSADGTARRWTLDGRELVRFERGAPVSVATFSPDGELVLAGVGYGWSEPRTRDFTLGLWSKSGELRAELRGHEDSVLAAAFSADGARIATASRDKTARVWDLEGTLVRTFRHPGYVSCVAFQPRDGADRVLTGCVDAKVRIWDVDGAMPNILHAHGAGMRTVVASRSGQRILTASSDQTAKLFDATGAVVAKFVGHAGPVESAAFSPDETRVLTRSGDHTARLWDVEVDELPILRGHVGGVYSAVFSRDQDRILTASADGTFRLWAASGELLREFTGHGSWVESARFSPDETLIVSASGDDTARLWNVADGALLHVLRGHAARVVAAFSPDGDIVATCSGDGTTRLWDVKSGAELDVSPLVPPGESGARDLAFSPIRPWIAVAYDSDRIARIWDIETGEVVRELRGHDGLVRDVAFAPGGRAIATASADETARIWSLDGSVRAVCRGHRGVVLGCAFSPDGELLATASRDGTARIWDRDGNELAVLRGHEGIVWSVAFSPDGRRLLTASFDMTVRTWIVDPNELLALADARLDRLERTFTPGELQRFGELLGR